MKFDEFGNMEGMTLMLLPGTACTWQINFHKVVDRLAERYHLICVNYDGFDDHKEEPFTDMYTVTEKIEDYIIENHDGHVDGAYGSSLGGSFVGLLLQRNFIHIDHAFIGSSDLDQGSPLVAKAMTAIVGRWIADAGKNEEKQEKLKKMLTAAFGSDNDEETAAFMEEFAQSIVSLAEFAKTAAAEGVTVVFRLWNRGFDGGNNVTAEAILRRHIPGEWAENTRGVRIRHKLHLEWGERFSWPNSNARAQGDSFFCYGLRDHFGILCDGTVVPCCLDSDGVIALGNIFTEELDEILNSERARKMVEEFNCRRASEELCKRCGYARRFV